MAIVEVTIVPLGTGSTSISNYVADCHRVLKEEKRIGDNIDVHISLI